MADDNNPQEIEQKIQELEDIVGQMRAVIGERRTMLSNADKKLQQFQDSMYAVLMEDNRPSRKPHRAKPDDHDETS